MREIKFRAWDKSQNKMYQVRGINFDNEDLWLKINETQIMGANLFEVELMQYTGLKDKNGIEIYEGDIVRCYGGEFCQGVYEYDESIRIDSLTNPFTMLCLTESENLEVVGNIYKNPELLEGVDND